MRAWQLERRRRTRHLIELGGLVVKAGIVDLTADNRAIIFGALLWMADKLQSEDAGHARLLWAGKGKDGFTAEGNEEQKSWRTLRCLARAAGGAEPSNIAALPAHEAVDSKL
ncbi:MAG: conjugal transfer protein TraD [Mesorhizobium sp.]|uniref:conjugal transfer protein TraD n=1 Tax=Mesorhizobium sp. TaxID=1871066 RepID=UPI0012222E07|nr:conjugal transfer protein TraD [Mesorhizobium sp.]TIN90664.1 MAG: conjugal transfer protein TraD [Mesorhizobium sp.]TJU93986.1 MAG: conjugal transfer protein TraD [Mesorhizobium sp.]